MIDPRYQLQALSIVTLSKQKSERQRICVKERNALNLKV